MKSTKKRIFALLFFPAAVLLLSGCGFNQVANEAGGKPLYKQDAVSPKEATVPTAPQPPASMTVPPLPADNKQAIDSEIQGIDESLKSIDASLSDDVQDGSLGL